MRKKICLVLEAADRVPLWVAWSRGREDGPVGGEYLDLLAFQGGHEAVAGGRLPEGRADHTGRGGVGNETLLQSAKVGIWRALSLLIAHQSVLMFFGTILEQR